MALHPCTFFSRFLQLFLAWILLGLTQPGRAEAVRGNPPAAKPTIPGAVVKARKALVSLRGKTPEGTKDGTGLVAMLNGQPYLVVPQGLLFDALQIDVLDGERLLLSCERLDAELCREVPLARFPLRGRLGPLPAPLPSVSRPTLPAYLLSSTGDSPILTLPAPPPPGNGFFTIVGEDGILQGFMIPGSTREIAVDPAWSWGYAQDLPDQLLLLADAEAMPPQVEAFFAAMAGGRERLANSVQEYRRERREDVFADPKLRGAMLAFYARQAGILEALAKFDVAEAEGRLAPAEKSKALSGFCSENAEACERLANTLAQQRRQLENGPWLSLILEDRAKAAIAAINASQQSLARAAAKMRRDAEKFQP